jgi:hypothetical protein
MKAPKYPTPLIKAQATAKTYVPLNPKGYIDRLPGLQRKNLNPANNVTVNTPKATPKESQR